MKVSRRAVIGALHSSYQRHSGRLVIPHYYFHVRRGQITVLDHEGIVLADTAHAKVEAAQRAEQVVNGEAMNGVSMNKAFNKQGVRQPWGDNRC